MILQRMGSRVLLVLMVAFLASNRRLMAGTSRELLDLKEGENEASLVVTGCVADVVTIGRQGEVVTKVATVYVASILKGKADAAISIRFTITSSVAKQPLENGECGVFFLKSSENGHFEAAFRNSFAFFAKR